MSSMRIVKDPEGQSFIPPSQRPDGTWRKPIRVRDGYVPQEEQPVYVSKGREGGDKPVGLSAYDVDSNNRATTPMGYFDARELLRQAAGIPGLNFVESADPLVPTKTKSKSKKKGTTTTSTQPAALLAGNTNTGNTASTSIKPSPTSTSTTNQSGAGAATDPSKRLRNLKKRLKEIEDLEKRISSGELTSPEKEQLEKLKRKDEVEEEIEDLELQIANLSLS